MLIYATVLFTILSAVGFGICAGYAAIVAILKLFGHRAERQKAAAPLRAAAAQSSGD